MSQKGLGSKQVTWEDAPESESSPIFLPFLKDGGWLPLSWSESFSKLKISEKKRKAPLS